MEKRKVIIDCDPGIDDSLAILLALNSDELEVLGLTITSGNVPARMGAKNALKTLQIANRLDIPVYVGEEFPLQRKLITAQDTHGEDGIGENFYDDVKGEILEGGVDFIIDTLKREEKVSIIALGPLTNIAKALMKDKDGFDNLDEFVSMGGAFRIHGNCSPVAEFNYWVDPHAADYTYKHLPKKIHMVGLDVTRKIVLTPNIIEFINRIEKEKSKFITEITRFYIDFHWQQEGIIGCVINDPLAIFAADGYLLAKPYYALVCDNMDITRGQMILDAGTIYHKEPNCQIVTSMKADEVDLFWETFIKIICK